jgi:signal transduction histidine kinase
MGALPGTQHAGFRSQLAMSRVGIARLAASTLRRHRLGPAYLRNVGLLVAAYYAAAHLGYALGFSGPVAAIVWLPVGVAVAALYLGGIGLWPGVVLGDLLVNNYSALPLGTALVQSAGNLAEVLIVVLVLHRLAGRAQPLATLRGVTVLMVAIAAGTVVSATVGSLASWVGGVISTGSLPYVWRTWWLGDAAGALIVVPLAIAWARPSRRWWGADRALEAGVTLVAVAGLSVLAFTSTGVVGALVFPPVIWAALRLGPRGATLAITITAGAALWGTTHHSGPFGIGAIDSRLLDTQLFIAIVSLSGLSIAALVAERERLADDLHASRARVVAASDAVRRRIERDLHDGAQQRLVVLAAHLTQAAEVARAEHSQTADALDTAQTDVLTAIDELRALARGIHPALLRQFGLGKAIAAVAAQSTIPVEIIGLPKIRLDDTAEATAYYVVVEAMTNAQKHSGASRIEVYTAMGACKLRIQVIDDGVGGAVELEGSGLQGLHDRVAASYGEFRVDSPRGGGTCITAYLPLTGRHEATSVASS